MTKVLHIVSLIHNLVGGSVLTASDLVRAQSACETNVSLMSLGLNFISTVKG